MKKKFIILFTLFLFIFSSAISYSESINNSLSNSLIRLHIVANSDSAEDLELKYKVRDSLLDYMNSLNTNVQTKQDALSIIENHISDFNSIVQKTILENGFCYDSKVIVSKTKFPTKTYGDISFPAGKYDALKIEIGNAEGKNWWCVMFPPLCFVDVTSGIVPEESKEIMKENLSDEEYELISENTSNINFKFKIVEMFQNIELNLAQN